MGNALQSRKGIIEGINVTPLVDIVLVLLVIFIVTAKFVVSPAIPLDLPTASTGTAVQTVFSVSLAADGNLYVDGAATQESQLTERAKAALASDRELRAVIQADGAVAHRRVIAVLDALKNAGVDRVAFGTSTPDSEVRDAPQ